MVNMNINEGGRRKIENKFRQSENIVDENVNRIKRCCNVEKKIRG